jgi:hypothetical protein
MFYHSNNTNPLKTKTMKKYLLTLFAIILLAGTSCQEKIDIEKEKEAIKAVIEGEIKASFNGDYDTWTTFFAHEPYAFWLQANNERYVSWKGWEEINSNAKEFLTPDAINVYKESALAVFKCKLLITETEDKLIGLEVRALEMKNGEWKITYLGTVYSSTYEEEEMESEEPEEGGPETEETEKN